MRGADAVCTITVVTSDIEPSFTLNSTKASSNAVRFRNLWAARRPTLHCDNVTEPNMNTHFETAKKNHVSPMPPICKVGGNTGMKLLTDFGCDGLFHGGCHWSNGGGHLNRRLNASIFEVWTSQRLSCVASSKNCRLVTTTETIFLLLQFCSVYVPMVTKAWQPCWYLYNCHSGIPSSCKNGSWCKS